MTDPQNGIAVEHDPQRLALRHAAAEDKQIRTFAMEVARLLRDRHCEDMVLFDVRGITDITDYILIATGTSDRQILSVGGELEDVGETHGMKRFGREVDEPTHWLVIDFIDVVVHLFDPPARAHYDLEMMWGDAPRVKWER